MQNFLVADSEVAELWTVDDLLCIMRIDGDTANRSLRGQQDVPGLAQLRANRLRVDGAYEVGSCCANVPVGHIGDPEDAEPGLPVLRPFRPVPVTEIQNPTGTQLREGDLRHRDAPTGCGRPALAVHYC